MWKLIRTECWFSMVLLQTQRELRFWTSSLFDIWSQEHKEGGAEARLGEEGNEHKVLLWARFETESAVIYWGHTGCAIDHSHSCLTLSLVKANPPSLFNHRVLYWEVSGVTRSLSRTLTVSAGLCIINLSVEDTKVSFLLWRKDAYKDSFRHSTSEEVVHRFLGEIQIRAIVCRYFHIQMLKQKARERSDSVTMK